MAFHEHLLLPVCESSNLGCLSYKCGPSVVCQQCTVQVTLPYIQKESESDAKTSPKQSMKCPECELGDYDINNCLGQVCGSFLCYGKHWDNFLLLIQCGPDYPNSCVPLQFQNRSVM